MLRDVTQARKSQMIRDTFIGVLSHELRTPVTTIYAGSKVLARDHEQLPRRPSARSSPTSSSSPSASTGWSRTSSR